MFKKVCVLFVFQVISISSFCQSLEIGGETRLLERVSQDQWISATIKTLNLEQKIGQLFMVSVKPFTDEKQYKDVAERVSKQNVGGIILSASGPVRQAHLIQRLQSDAKVPLLVGMDAELGLGKTMDSTLSYPTYLTLGAIQDNQLLYELGAEIARQCKLMGIHINFAPAMNINSGTTNMEVAYNSFGENAEKATAKGMAYMQGMEDYGIIACFRHISGEFLNTELRSASGSQSISNGTYPMPSPYLAYNSRRPLGSLVARFNEPVVEGEENRSFMRASYLEADMLSNRMELDGLVFSDAISQYDSDKKPGETELEAFLAGNDVLLFPHDLTAAIKKIKKAVSEGKVTEEEIDKRVSKVLRIKYMAGLDAYKPADTHKLYEKLNKPEALLLKEKLYEQAVTVVNDQSNLLPIQVLDTASFASLSISVGEDSFASSFQNMLNQYASFNHYDISQKEENSWNYNAIFNRLKRYEYVIIGVNNIEQLYGENQQMLKNSLTFLKFLQDETNVILVVFDSPYELKYFEDFKHVVCAYQEEADVQKIVPQQLFGALPIMGKLPVSPSVRLQESMGEIVLPLNRLRYTLPEAVGLSSDTLRLIDSLANKAIADHSTPGCQILVARKGAVVFQKSYGYFTYDSITPVNNETIYDIASVTKVVATLQAVMFLEERGIINLDAYASEYLSELKGTNKENLKVRDILLHRAGLLSFVPFWAHTKKQDKFLPEFYSDSPKENYSLQIARGIYGCDALADSIWQWTIDSRLRKPQRNVPAWKPRYSYRYSDLSFYMLKKIVERVTNQPLQDFLDQNFYASLGLATTTYLPLCKFPEERIPPSAEDNYFRKTIIQGMVHDEGASLMGGVAGHAGLFSNANDLAVLMQMNLQDGKYGGHTYFQEGTIERFARRQYNDNRRGLGWDKPEIRGDDGPTAPEASPTSFGHLGFTGTAVWVDPKYDLVFVFLSNRTYPDTRNTKLLTDGIRTKIHSVIYKAMMDYHTTLVE